MNFAFRSEFESLEYDERKENFDETQRSQIGEAAGKRATGQVVEKPFDPEFSEYDWVTTGPGRHRKLRDKQSDRHVDFSD